MVSKDPSRPGTVLPPLLLQPVRGRGAGHRLHSGANATCLKKAHARGAHGHHGRGSPRGQATSQCRPGRPLKSRVYVWRRQPSTGSGRLTGPPQPDLQEASLPWTRPSQGCWRVAVCPWGRGEPPGSRAQPHGVSGRQRSDSGRGRQMPLCRRRGGPSRWGMLHDQPMSGSDGSISTPHPQRSHQQPRRRLLAGGGVYTARHTSLKGSGCSRCLHSQIHRHRD